MISVMNISEPESSYKSHYGCSMLVLSSFQLFVAVQIVAFLCVRKSNFFCWSYLHILFLWSYLHIRVCVLSICRFPSNLSGYYLVPNTYSSKHLLKCDGGLFFCSTYVQIPSAEFHKPTCKMDFHCPSLFGRATARISVRHARAVWACLD